MNRKGEVLALFVSTVAVMFTSLSYGGYDANELKNEIARKERNYKWTREARVKMEEYANDRSYYFMVNPENGNIYAMKREEVIENMPAAVLYAFIQKGKPIPDDADINIWIEFQMAELRQESERKRKEIKASLPVLDSYCESLAVEIEFLKDRLAELEAGGPWVKGSATVGVDPIDQIAGKWSFGRIDKDGSKKKFLCNLTLTKERTDSGYVIKGCHHNESFWVLEGMTTILLKNDKGVTTSTLGKVNDNFWQGEYHPPEDMPVAEGETILDHYIERTPKPGQGEP